MSPGADGRLWPVRDKGCSVRLHEVADVIGGLRRAADLVVEAPRATAASGTASLSSGPFDEFGG